MADWESLGPEVLSVPWWDAAVADPLRGLIDAAPQVTTLVLFDPGGDEEAQLTEARHMLSALASGDVDGLVLASDPTDALKEVENGVVVRSLDRAQLITLSPPAVLQAEAVRAALDDPDKEGTCLQMLVACGGRVRWRKSFS